MRAIIAGGGTGGHIFPAVAIGHTILRHYPDADILFVGANGKMEMEKVPQEGFEIIGLDIVGFNRSNLLKNITLPFKLIKSRMKANEILKERQPDIVIGVGGFASFPMLNAAQARGIPTLIQEQNSYAGKSNKILGRAANRVCVAYDQMETFFPKEKIVLTGNPVRSMIVDNNKTRAEGLRAYGLDSNKRTLLVVGGSLGALSVNKALARSIEALASCDDWQVLWQTGKPFFNEAVRIAEPYGNVLVRDFIRDMDHAYVAADLIVSRAGAMAISELCIVGKPVIFVPYPHAAEDHQTSNAMALVKKNAAMMVKDSEVEQDLVASIKALMSNQSKMDGLSEEIKKYAILDADERIFSIINKIVKS